MPAPAPIRRLADMAALAVLYVITARLGQLFAIPPGNITPVWIPSGIMLVAVMRRGYWIWPGIFIGAFIGNAWAYVDPHNTDTLLRSLLAGLSNGAGDSLGTALGAWLLVRGTKGRPPFDTTSDLLRFALYPVVLGSSISAFFGVTSLASMGFISWDQYAFSFATWWVGDSAGILLIAPAMLIAWEERRDYRLRPSEIVFIMILAVTFPMLSSLPWTRHIEGFPSIAILPLLAWAALRFQRTNVFASIPVIAASTLTWTAMGHGPLTSNELTTSIINIQLYLMMLSIPALVLSAALREGYTTMTASHELERQTRDLRESQSLLNGIVNSTSDCVYAKDLQGRYVVFNPAAEALTNTTALQAIGKDDYELFASDSAREIMRRDREIMTSGKPQQFTENVITSTGHEVTLHTAKGPLYDAAGKVSGLFGIAREITDTYRAQQRAAESESKFRRIVDSSMVAIMFWHRDGRVTGGNQALADLLGCTLDDINNGRISWNDTTAPEFLERDQQALDEVATKGVCTPYEKHFLHRDGRRVPVLIGGASLGPETHAGVAFLVDLTHLKETELARLAAETRYRMLFMTMGEEFHMWKLVRDERGEIQTWTLVDANPQTEKTWKRPIDDCRGKTHEEIFGEPVTEHLMGKVREAFASGAPVSYADYIPHMGCHYWFTTAPMGEYFITTALDITPLKRAEAEILAANARLRRVIDSNMMAICFWKNDGYMTGANQAFCDILGCSLEDANSGLYRWVDATPPEAYPRDIQGMREIAENGACVPYEKEFIHRDGHRVPVLIGGASLDENVNQGIAFAIDLTEIKRLQHQEAELKAQVRLQQTQRMESLGVLAGGIAHDFNNILTGIMGNASLGLSRVPEGSPMATLLGRIESASERAADLTRQMLAYAGKGKFWIEPVNLSSLVREMESLLHSSIPKNVNLRLDLDDNCGTIESDATQMRQIVMNLIINAAESLGDRVGTVSVTTRLTHLDEAFLHSCRASDDARPGLFTRLDVIDDGCGMDEATIARVFDPFFTTKFTGRGLGLSAVLGILRAHHGAIHIQSSPGKGSHFTVAIPVSADNGTSIPQESAPVRDGSKGTVLVIDDEEVVRDTTRTTLESAGYRVITANDGPAGIALYRQHQSEIVAIQLDLTMPTMRGDDVFRALRTINRNVRAIIMSGYMESEVMAMFGADRPSGFLQKPFKADHLLDRLAAALNAQSP